MTILIVVAVIGLFVIGLAWLDGGREEQRLIQTPAHLPDSLPDSLLDSGR